MTRVLAAVAVLAVAVVAAIVSFAHIETAALSYGQTILAARLLPVSIDGSIVAASMVLLDYARRGDPAPALARILLGLGMAATLGANAVSGVGHGPIGVVVAMAPAVLFIGSAEVFLTLVRGQAQETPAAEALPTPDQAPDPLPTAMPASPPPARTRPASKALLPKASQGREMSPEPADVFRAELERGELPGIRTIKARARCGQPRAEQIRDELTALTRSARTATLTSS